jgi:hypothetical protein
MEKRRLPTPARDMGHIKSHMEKLRSTFMLEAMDIS